MKLYTGIEITNGCFDNIDVQRWRRNLLIIQTKREPLTCRILCGDNRRQSRYNSFDSANATHINSTIRELSKIEFKKYYANVYRKYLLLDIPPDILELLDTTIRTNYSGGVNKFKKYK